MAKYLVTGAAGFIGSHLVRALVERGDEVRGFDNFSTGKRENLVGVDSVAGGGAGFSTATAKGAVSGRNDRYEAGPADFLALENANAGVSPLRSASVEMTESWRAGSIETKAPEGSFEMVEGDLRDAEAVARACVGMDFVLHQAALPSVPRSVKDPRASHEVNLSGTLHVLEGARAAGVKRVVYAASSSAYGNQPGFPRVETMRAEPVSPYAVQKVAGEMYMQSWCRVYGLETVSLRYFNVFGPRQDAGSAYAGVVARWIGEMLQGVQPVIFGDGEQGRDFTYVENVVRANLLACAAPAEDAAGRVFNVACGERRTLNELYAALARLTGYASAARYEAARVGDVRDSLADVSAARVGFGYAPEVGFGEGLTRTAAWQRVLTP